MALKQAHGGAAWTDWDAGSASREPDAFAIGRQRLKETVERYRIEQYFFYRQFDAIGNAAAARGIKIMGDLPIYVAHDSADVWADRDAFKLHPDGRPVVVAGVPPDY